MNPSSKSSLAVFTIRKASIFLAAALLVVAASAWAMTGGSQEIAGAYGHYNLQPLW